MLITAAGVIIRMPVDQISQMGRNTQGVRLIRLEDEQEVATVAKAQKMMRKKRAKRFLQKNKRRYLPLYFYNNTCIGRESLYNRQSQQMRDISYRKTC